MRSPPFVLDKGGGAGVTRSAGLLLIDWRPLWTLRTFQGTPFIRFPVAEHSSGLFVGGSWWTFSSSPFMIFFWISSLTLSLRLLSHFRCKFFSLTETPENYTVVLDEEGFKGRTPLCTYLFLQGRGFVFPPLSSAGRSVRTVHTTAQTTI